MSLLRTTNHVVTDLRYVPDALDVSIMDAEAVPLLQLNRLPLAAADGNRGLASFLGTALVRRHPMMTYHLLRTNADTLALHLQKSSLSEAAPGDDRGRKRQRPSS